MAQGWISGESTLSQICFGVEVVSTDDTDATFQMSAFSIDTKSKTGQIHHKHQVGGKQQ